MKKRLYFMLVLICCGSYIVTANKTSVKLNLPPEVKKGTEVTIVVSVTHKGNSKLHHTEWVNLTVNNQTVKRWEFTKKNLPASENFTLEYRMIVAEDMVIKAEANCNLHGSEGIIEATIKSN